MAISKTANMVKAAAISPDFGGMLGVGLHKAFTKFPKMQEWAKRFGKTIPWAARTSYSAGKVLGKGVKATGKGLWRGNVFLGKQIAKRPLVRNSVLPGIAVGGILASQLPKNLRANMMHVDPTTDITHSTWNGVQFKDPQYYDLAKQMNMFI